MVNGKKKVIPLKSNKGTKQMAPEAAGSRRKISVQNNFLVGPFVFGPISVFFVEVISENWCRLSLKPSLGLSQNAESSVTILAKVMDKGGVHPETREYLMGCDQHSGYI